MAVGRQDYQAGVVPIKSGYSLSQAPYFKNHMGVVAVANFGIFCEYEVPVGYQLMLGGYRIGSNKPCQQIYSVLIDGHVQLQAYFDMSILDNFPDNSPMIVSAGETLSMVVYNSDTVAHVYAVTMFGYLEQIET